MVNAATAIKAKADNTDFVQTDIGLLPSDWDVVSLAQVGDPKIGLTYSPSNVRPHGVLVLRSSNVQDGRLSFDDNVYVEMDVPSRALVRPGDVLICVRNGSRELIGKCALIDARAEGMAFGAFMSVFRSNIGEYVFWVFQSDVVKRQIVEHLGATINQITNKSLSSFKIPIPQKKAETDRIVRALSDVDELIGSLEKLIAKKRAMKTATMQQLLTGKKRLPGFSGQWKTAQLGEIGHFRKGTGIRKDSVLESGLPCVRYGEIYTRHHDYIKRFYSFISPSTASEASPIKAGDLLFAGSGETLEEIGKCVAYLSDEDAFAGGDIVIYRAPDQDAKYLGFLMNHQSVVVQKMRMGQGDAVVHIHAKNLAGIEVHLPPVDEQKAISDMLSDMDLEIGGLQKRLSKTKAIKQGKMQELLTGRTRLV